MRTWRETIAVVMVSALAACGGSGSTGLISPENALLDDVRRDGDCVTSEEMVTYCATDAPDAVAPNGTSADGPVAGAPQATPTPAATPMSPGAGVTGTPADGPTPGGCVPGGDTCPGAPLVFDVQGFDEGAACALAARPFGSDGAWSTGALVPVGGPTTSIAPPLPEGVGPGEIEIALLCYEVAPDAIPAEIASLADAAPDVVFVPAEPVGVEGEIS